MGKRGFVRANADDSERPEMGMRCGKSYPHASHNWQMSATGWCACDGRESTPIYDSLISARSSEF